MMIAQTKSFIQGMEKAGRLAAETLKYVGGFVRAGVTTLELDQLAHEYILTRGARPAPLNYHGFPKSICTSVNEVICHGVPDEYKLKSGDILNIDVTTIVDGHFGDTSATFLVDEVSDKAQRIAEAAKSAMERGIEAIEPGARTGDIGFAIGKFATRLGYWPVKEIGGHGIGTQFHTDPFVPSHGKKGKGELLIPWRCITVEPMLNETDSEIVEHAIPGSSIMWYSTKDKSLSAQFEHTVLITDSGYEIMTLS